MTARFSTCTLFGVQNWVRRLTKMGLRLALVAGVYTIQLQVFAVTPPLSGGAHPKGSNKVLVIRTTDELTQAQESYNFFKQEAKLADAACKIEAEISLMVDSDQHEGALIASGLAGRYGKDLGNCLANFQKEYKLLFTTEHCKKYGGSPEFQASFGPVVRHVEKVETGVKGLISGLGPDEIQAKWGGRRQASTTHSSAGYMAQQLQTVLHDLNANLADSVANWTGSKDKDVKKIVAISPDVMKARSQPTKASDGTLLKDRAALIGLSVSARLLNIGGVDFSLFSLNATPLAVASPSVSGIALNAEMGSLLEGDWLVPAAAEQLSEATEVLAEIVAGGVGAEIVAGGVGTGAEIVAGSVGTGAEIVAGGAGVAADVGASVAEEAGSGFLEGLLEFILGLFGM